jgi:Ca2+-binding RTX toxin-like protein
LDTRGRDLPLARRPRLGLLALGVLVVALVTASASFGGAAPPGRGLGCTPVVRTLSNGDPTTTEGAVSVTVDGLGAYGRGTAAGDAFFNPSGVFSGSFGTTYTSNLYVSTVGHMLQDDCGDGQVQVISESPLHTQLAIGSLQLDLTQVLEPITLGGSRLRQTYTLTNTSGAPVDPALVRLLDGDLKFDGSSGVLDGAKAIGPLDGSGLRELDSVPDDVPRGFLELTGALDGAQAPNRWTIQPFDYRPVVEGAGGIPPADSGVVFNDSDGNLEADSPFDVTMSQQWNASIAPSASVTLETATRFDAENRPPDAGFDNASTAPGTAVDINVLSNDSDPDGDPVSVGFVSQPEHGTTSLNADQTVHYVPAPGYRGPDGFHYNAGDGRNGTGIAEVDITVGGLTLTVNRTGNGRVVSSPPGIDCGAACTADFVSGAAVTLTASPDAGWTFNGWTGACSGTGPCTVTMDTAKTVGAAFLPPPPTGGESADVQVTRGTVLIKVPGGQFVELSGATQIPVGSQIDTTSGAVELTVARGATLDKTEFYDGLFTLQQQSANTIAQLRLDGGDFGQCLGSFRALAKRKPVRRLWGSGKGHYRTRGRYSSAVVRGTKWLTQDVCDGTLTKVEEGVVQVHDFTRNKDVKVRAGHQYVAEALPRGLRNAGCTIVGTNQRDYLEGTPKRDVICGLAGDDVITGVGGNDRLIGGPGNDRLLAGVGDDVLSGNEGKDFLNGGPGNDALYGGPGNDFMVTHDGGRGNDRLAGGPGRDRCYTDWVKACR